MMKHLYGQFSTHAKPSLTVAGLCLLLVTVLVYGPGLHGPTLFDDTTAIFGNPQMTAIAGFDGRQIAAATWSGDAGPLKRPVSMLTFALNYAAAGADLFYFKATNLAVHLVTGLSLSYFSWLFLTVCRRRVRAELSSSRIGWLSVMVAAAWLLHPLNLTPVLHIVQRMTGLCALFTVWGLICHLLGRVRLHENGRSMAGWLLIGGGLFGFGALAVLSKENGVLLPLYIILIEALVFDFQSRSPQGRRLLIGFCAVFVLLSIAFGLHYLGAFRPGGLSGAYVNRPFDLRERLLTEGRVLWFYVHLLLFPDIRQMGVFHDDFILSTGLLSPLTTLLAWLCWLFTILLALFTRRKAPLFSFAVGFFLIGHSMESGIIALDLIHEHRNYLPGFGILLALFYYLTHPRLKALSNGLAGGAAGTVMLAVSAFGTSARAQDWSEKISLLASDVKNHPQSERSNLMLGQALLVVVEEHMAQGHNDEKIRSLRASLREVFENVRRTDDHYLNGHVSLLLLDELEGRRPDQGALLELTRRLKRPPLSVNVLGLLLGLADRRVGEGRGLSAETLMQLYAAVSKNPGLRGRRKAGVLADYAKLADDSGDKARALRLAQQAVEMYPNDRRLLALLAVLRFKSGGAVPMEGTDDPCPAACVQ